MHIVSIMFELFVNLNTYWSRARLQLGLEEWSQVGGGGAGLEILAGQRTMSGLIGGLTSQMFAFPVMLTSHIPSY